LLFVKKSFSLFPERQGKRKCVNRTRRKVHKPTRGNNLRHFDALESERASERARRKIPLAISIFNLASLIFPNTERERER